MSAIKIEEQICSLVLPLLADTGLELVDVEYVREKDWYLRVFINKPGGIEIDDCQLVSERLTKALDEQDPIKEKYYLEVSSPGIDRPLKKDADFLRMYEKKVDITFKDTEKGSKKLTAVLKKHTDTELQLEDGKQTLEIARDRIKIVRPHIDF